tara:strand:+ start:170 stop:505 length:336 start_codon:yes stop_codon:yes gene_type:complete
MDYSRVDKGSNRYYNGTMMKKDREEILKELIDENDGDSMLNFLWASDEVWFENTDIMDIRDYFLDQEQEKYVQGAYSDGRSLQDIFIDRFKFTDDDELKLVLKKMDYNENK